MHLIRMRVLFGLQVLFCISVYAQIDFENQENNYYRKKGYVILAGEQSGEYAERLYIVTKDVYIKKNTQMIFSPGVRIFFKKNTRLLVDGSLVCHGSPKMPIVFTKLENENYFAPSDANEAAVWQGIEMGDSSSLTMRYAIISKSAFGITASSQSSNLKLDSILFSDNNTKSLKIQGQSFTLNDNVYFSFPVLIPATAMLSPINPPVIETPKLPPPVPKSRVVPPKPISIEPKRPPTHYKKYVQIPLAAFVLATGAVSGFYQYRGYSYYVKYDKSTDPSLISGFKEISKHSEKRRDKGLLATGICASLFLVTIPFDF